MGAIDYGRFQRALQRSAEVGAEPAVGPSVARTYSETLKTAAEAFLAAHVAARKAETSFRRAHCEAFDALAALNTGYRQARAVVLAFAPGTVLPEALRSLSTDTERLDALEQVLDALDDHAGESWADQLAQGAFGQLAAGVVRELNEAIARNPALSAAREARAAAYGPAYEGYLRFKRVVRDALGPKSRYYQRIHLRSPSVTDLAPETLPEPPVTVPMGRHEAAPPSTHRKIHPLSQRELPPPV
jgi:hypothetical protein